jgi:hypothetical protein
LESRRGAETQWFAPLRLRGLSEAGASPIIWFRLVRG